MSLSTLRRTKDEIEFMNRKKAEIGIQPPIEFWASVPVRKEGNVSKTKNLFATFSVPLNFRDMKKGATYEEHVKKFSHGTPEEFCMHMRELDELAEKLGYSYFTKYKKKKKK